jgi:transcriptional regulator with PAS, ATPase and Fis domain
MKPLSSPKQGKTDLTLFDMETRMINHAIEKHNGNLSAAAEQLGISRQTLYNKIKKTSK